MKIRANNIDIEVEDSGPGTPGPARPVVLLIMGLGMQLVAWPPEMVKALEAAGYRVVRFDNRDVGLSQKFDGIIPDNAANAKAIAEGRAPNVPYTLNDMADDVAALTPARMNHVGARPGSRLGRSILGLPQE